MKVKLFVLFWFLSSEAVVVRKKFSSTLFLLLKCVALKLYLSFKIGCIINLCIKIANILKVIIPIDFKRKVRANSCLA